MFNYHQNIFAIRKQPKKIGSKKLLKSIWKLESIHWGWIRWLCNQYAITAYFHEIHGFPINQRPPDLGSPGCPSCANSNTIGLKDVGITSRHNMMHLTLLYPNIDFLYWKLLSYYQNPCCFPCRWEILSKWLEPSSQDHEMLSLHTFRQKSPYQKFSIV